MDPHRPQPAPERTWRERVKALENVGPLLRMVWATSPPLTLASLTGRLLRSGLPLATLYVGKLIIDAVVHTVRTGEADSGRIWKLVAIELALAVTSDLLGRAVALADSLLGDRFTNRVSVELMRHASTLDLAHFEEPEFYDKLERARRQTMGRLQLMSQVMGAAQDLLTLATLTASLLVFSPWLLLLLVCAVVPSFLGETHFASLSYSLLYRWTPQRRELDYLRWLGATQESAKEVKIFGLGDYLTERYRRLADLFYRENRILVLRRAAVGSVLALVGTGGYYGAYVVILYRTLHGILTVGDLTLLAAAFARSRGLIEGVLGTFSNVTEQAMYLDDLFAFFRMRPRIASPPGALPAPRPVRRGFEFQNVSFRYPDAEHDAIHSVSFELRPGERLALIGENGAGKTTVAKLFARLYDPTAGRILLDGADLRDYDIEELRREIGVIFQDYMRYQMLLWENIGLGRVEEVENRTRIERAARLSLASEVAVRLERGLDQMIGRRFAGGVDLSGGEWQKVALGRAYMRDAQLLILDEPTATLDARAEHRVFERFAELTRGKMAVLISHRFSTVRMADRILVLNHGEIHEQGTHEELLGLGGQYAELFELQAAGYR
ncbi:MAG: ABC transporter ATP-binding protein [Acidobacteria bacterium]|nr:ABC transporter ATP-binding protein [Acidobacteriota bacterium]